jgi:hypothetical protein
VLIVRQEQAAITTDPRVTARTIPFEFVSDLDIAGDADTQKGAVLRHRASEENAFSGTACSWRRSRSRRCAA